MASREITNGLRFSEYSDVLTAKTTGGTPSEPEPPSLIESTPSALTLTWKKREGDDEYQLYMEDAQTVSSLAIGDMAESYGYLFRVISRFSKLETSYTQCQTLPTPPNTDSV